MWWLFVHTFLHIQAIFILTFSHPSIFSLFLSLLLGFESTLIREPRESVWFPDATAKEEKAAGGGVHQTTYSHVYFKCMQRNRRTHTATCDGVENLFGKGGIY